MKNQTVFVVSLEDKDTKSVSHEPYNSDALFFAKEYDGIRRWVTERHPKWKIEELSKETRTLKVSYDDLCGKRQYRVYRIYCRSLY